MRISDWSSDVCSSDLAARAGPLNPSRPTCGIIARSFSAQLEFYVLDFLISPAFAQQAAATSPQGLLAAFWPLLVMIPLFYFLLLRPQSKRANETRAMLRSEDRRVGDKRCRNDGLRWWP